MSVAFSYYAECSSMCCVCVYARTRPALPWGSSQCPFPAVGLAPWEAGGPSNEEPVTWQALPRSLSFIPRSPPSLGKSC